MTSIKERKQNGSVMPSGLADTLTAKSSAIRPFPFRVGQTEVALAASARMCRWRPGGVGCFEIHSGNSLALVYKIKRQE